LTNRLVFENLKHRPVRTLVSALAIGVQVTLVGVPDWWPISTAISIAGALCGALYPGLKAARQSVIDALAYE